MKPNTHPKLANGQPAISCFALPLAELLRRETAAHHRAERLALAEETTPCDTGRFQLWHVECRWGVKLVVCDEELFRLAASLPSTLLEMNGGQPLDFFDYGYVADLLRELLFDATLAPGDAQNVRRALAWVEARGSGLRDYGLEA